MAAQLDLLPSIVVEYPPFPNKVGKGRAIADNGLAYVVKADNDLHRCATEWVGTYIAEALNLPVPQTKILQLPNGELVFGSEMMTNRLPDHQVASLLLQGKVPNDLYLPAIGDLLSQIHALDVFLGNHDRHEENFLISLETAADGRRIGNVRPFDFESSDILRRQSLRLPMNPASNTIKTGRVIRAVHAFNTRPVSQMLTRLRQGREFIIDSATRGLPKEWLSVTQRDTLMKRVASAQFERELVQLEQGLNDGTYR